MYVASVLTRLGLTPIFLLDSDFRSVPELSNHSDGFCPSVSLFFALQVFAALVLSVSPLPMV